jgi:acetyl-CoA synthetase
VNRFNAEVVIWGEGKFGFPILENWWQTETVGIMIQLSFDESKTGSMGKPLPGIEIAIAEVNGQRLKIITEPTCKVNWF